MEHITSPKNETVKLVRSLSLKKHRSEMGLFVAEGRAVIDRARLLGWAPQILLLSDETPAPELIAWCQSHGGRSSTASQAVMEAVSSQGNPSDCVGVFAQRWLDDMLKVEPGALWLALETIRDPGNLGTIIRTAEAVSAAGIILIGPSCDPYARDCVRATMGSIFALPLLKLENAQGTDLLKSWPGETVGTASSAREDYRRAYRSPTLLIMGSEGGGLSPESTKLCKSLVRIPMSGGTESLNLAVATGLMLYEIRRASLA